MMKGKLAWVVLSVVFLLQGSVFSQESDPDSSSATADRIKQIQERKLLRIAIAPDFAPFVFKDKEGKTVGIDMDIASAIAKHLGVRLLIEEAEFPALFTIIREGRADLIISGITVTEERKKKCDFSLPYFTSGQVLMIREEDSPRIRNLHDLVEKPVGVQKGTTSEDLLMKESKAAVKSFTDNDEAVKKLVEKEVDAVLVDSTVVGHFLNQYGSLVILGEVLGTEDIVEDYAIAVRKGDPLLPEINTVIKELKNSNEYGEIIRQWYSVK